MNILIITDKLFPDEAGGSCTYAYETAINLNKLNNKVDIVTAHPEKSSNDVFFKDIKVYRYLNKRNPYKSSLEVQKIIRNNKYEYVIIHSPIAWFIFYLAKRKVKCKIKEIGIFHGPWHREAKLKYASKKQYYKFPIICVMKFIEHMYAKKVKNFIFLSEYMRKELIKICSEAQYNNFKIIPGGVNIEKYKCKYSKIEARRKLGLPNNEFIVFSLRRLEYRMGLHVAIDAMDGVNIEKKVTYIIGGKGPFESQLKKKAKSLKKAKCIFEGFISEDELSLYFRSADLFLVPSIDLEGFGLVILESLAMGLPVITTPQGGMIELKNKLKNFYITDSCKKDDLSFAINKFYNNQLYNNVESQDLSKYSWLNISQELMDFLYTIND